MSRVGVIELRCELQKPPFVAPPGHQLDADGQPVGRRRGGDGDGGNAGDVERDREGDDGGGAHQPDGRVGVLDWGILGRLSPETHDHLRSIIAAALGDEAAWARVVDRVSQQIGPLIEERMGIGPDELPAFVRGITLNIGWRSKFRIADGSVRPLPMAFAVILLVVAASAICGANALPSSTGPRRPRRSGRWSVRRYAECRARCVDRV